MKCPVCGAENPEGMNFCGDCGNIIVHPSPQPLPRGRGSMKPESIILAVVVAALISIVAILYFMDLGSDETSTPTGPSGLAATYSKGPITNGEQVNIVSITKTDVAWDQIKVQVSDGSQFWEWNTATADLDGGSAVTMDYGAPDAGTAVASLNVTDVGGNGFVSGSDYFRVTFSGGLTSGLTYTAVLIYTETGEKIGTGVYFTG